MRFFELSIFILVFNYGCSTGIFVLPNGTENSKRKNDIRGDEPVKVEMEKVSSDKFRGKLSATSEKEQVIEPVDGELVGTKIAFPPGSLIVDTEVLVAAGQQLDQEVKNSLFDGSGMQVDSASTSVYVKPDQEIDPANPFTLSVNIKNTAAALTERNLVVFYKVFVFSVQEYRLGVLPAQNLRLEEGKVSFDAKHFGVYQAVYMPIKIAEEQSKQTFNPPLLKGDQNQTIEAQVTISPAPSKATNLNFEESSPHAGTEITTSWDLTIIDYAGSFEVQLYRGAECAEPYGELKALGLEEKSIVFSAEHGFLYSFAVIVVGLDGQKSISDCSAAIQVVQPVSNAPFNLTWVDGTSSVLAANLSWENPIAFEKIKFELFASDNCTGAAVTALPNLQGDTVSQTISLTELTTYSFLVTGFVSDKSFQSECSISKSIGNVSPPLSPKILSWKESSPHQGAQGTASWTHSESQDLSTQTLTYFEGNNCQIQVGDPVYLGKEASEQVLNVEHDKTYTFRITSVDTEGNASESQCSPTLRVDYMPNSLGEVKASFPNHGSNWLDFVKQGYDEACDPSKGLECTHGGEARSFIVDGLPSCENVEVQDALNAFKWNCDISSGNVVISSIGLKSDKGLSDLITTTGFKSNSVTVSLGSKSLSTESSVWWSNSFEAIDLCSPGTLESGKIYTVSENKNCPALEVKNKQKIAIVMMDDSIWTITSNACSSSCGLGFTQESHFGWFEGIINGGTNQKCLKIEHSDYFNLRKSSFSQCNDNSINVGGSNYGKYDSITSHSNGGNSVWLHGSSENNYFENLALFGNSNGSGVFLQDSDHNTFSRLKTFDHYWSGVHADNSKYLKLYDVIVANNGMSGTNVDGIKIDNQSSYFMLIKARVYNNAKDGIFVESNSHNATITDVISSNNKQSGIDANATNLLIKDFTAVNNALQGIRLVGANNSTVVNVLVANNGQNGIFGTSDEVKYIDVAASGNQSSNVYVSGNNNLFTGSLFVNGSCSESGSGNNLNSSCEEQNTLDEVLIVNDFDVDSSLESFTFVGRVSDSVNSQSGPNKSYGELTDWVGFSSDTKIWGRGDAEAIFDVSNRGACATGDTCAIWDFALKSDSSLLTVSECPESSDAINHEWSDSSSISFLKGARELPVEGNIPVSGLCTGNQNCLEARSRGAYQGHGELQKSSSCTALGQSGTIQNVKFFARSSQGK